MAYDAKLADRIDAILAEVEEVTDRQMFGGLAFMVAGNMCCGVTGENLMLRLGVDGATEALSDPTARPMDFTGRPMKGFVYVSPAGTSSDADLRRLVDMALAFVETLPPKR